MWERTKAVLGWGSCRRGTPFVVIHLLAWQPASVSVCLSLLMPDVGQSFRPSVSPSVSVCCCSQHRCFLRVVCFEIIRRCLEVLGLTKRAAQQQPRGVRCLLAKDPGSRMSGPVVGLFGPAEA